jgi:hypothetical protein
MKFSIAAIVLTAAALAAAVPTPAADPAPAPPQSSIVQIVQLSKRACGQFSGTAQSVCQDACNDVCTGLTDRIAKKLCRKVCHTGDLKRRSADGDSTDGGSTDVVAAKAQGEADGPQAAIDAKNEAIAEGDYLNTRNVGRDICNDAVCSHISP